MTQYLAARLKRAGRRCTVQVALMKQCVRLRLLCLEAQVHDLSEPANWSSTSRDYALEQVTVPRHRNGVFSYQGSMWSLYRRGSDPQRYSYKVKQLVSGSASGCGFTKLG